MLTSNYSRIHHIHSKRWQAMAFRDHVLMVNLSQFDLKDNTTNASPVLYLRTHYSFMLFYFIVLVTSAVVGSFGNLLVILTIALVRSLRTYGNMFILNLALADLVMTGIVVPFNALGSFVGETAYMNDNMLCVVVGSVCAISCMGSMWNMCVISLNRYVLICYPHLYKRIFTRTSTFLICLAVWLICHLAHMPNHIGWGRIKFSKDLYLCTFDVDDTLSYATFYICMGVFVPLVGVLFGYARIFAEVRAVKTRMREHRRRQLLTTRALEADGELDGKGQQTVAYQERESTFEATLEDARLARTLFLAFIVFLLCWSPYALLVLLGQPATWPKWISIVTIILAHSNSAMNPIVYGLFNDKFRDGYRSVTGCHLPRVGSTAAASSGARAIIVTH